MKAELLTNFIPISRKLFEHRFWSEERAYSRFEAWIDLIQSARFEDTKTYIGNKVIYIKRGEVLASLRFLATRWKWGKTKVDGFLELLEADSMISKRTDQKTGQTIIIICNYDKYNTSKDTVKTDDETPPRHLQDSDKTKSNKENIENNISITIKGQQKFLKQSLFQTLDILLKDENWIEVYLMNNGFHPSDKELFCDYLKSFFILEQDRGETYKTEKDAKQHFVNWLRLILEEQTKKHAKQKQAGGGHSRNQSQPISKVGSMLDIVGELLHPQN